MKSCAGSGAAILPGTTVVYWDGERASLFTPRERAIERARRYPGARDESRGSFCRGDRRRESTFGAAGMTFLSLFFFWSLSLALYRVGLSRVRTYTTPPV